MVDLINPDSLRERLSLVLPYKNAFLQKLYGLEPLDFDKVYKEYRDFGRRLAPFVADTASMVQEALARGETVLLEGAQGSLLDLDSGTYEYVTSSVPSSTAAGAALGIGIGPTQISRVVAVYKAYQTRVGNGPMPSELTGAMGEELREKGQEYGATTGRPRRCGWFDAVVARDTARLNNIDAAVITRLDVLDTFASIKVCTAYHINGAPVTTFPAARPACARRSGGAAGWQEPTTHVRRFQDLPRRAQDYVKRLESLLGCPVALVSVGPERDQAIIVKPII
jgi:adenylosuccinate synthase